MFDLPDTLAVAVITAQGVLLAAFAAVLGHVWKRIADLESSQRELWRARESDAVTKRALGSHIDVLEDHIWQDKGPPPPPRPVGI
jgi:hypothetical protein